MKKKYRGIAFILILMLLAAGCGKADVNVGNDGSMESPVPDALEDEENSRDKEEEALGQGDNPAGEEADEKQENNAEKEDEARKEEKIDSGSEKPIKTEAPENPEKNDADSVMSSKKTPAVKAPVRETDAKAPSGDSSTKKNKAKEKDRKKAKETNKAKTKDKISSPEKKEEPKTLLDKALIAVKEALGDKYNADTAVDSGWLLNVCGIEEDWYDASVGEQPMISANVDTYISIHATKGNVKKVAAALKEYRRYLIEDSMQYPMNQPKVEACKVMTKGDYVFFVMLGVLDDMEMDESEQKSAYEAINQTAIEAIERVIS